MGKSRLLVGDSDAFCSRVEHRHTHSQQHLFQELYRISILPAFFLREREIIPLGVCPAFRKQLSTLSQRWCPLRRASGAAFRASSPTQEFFQNL